MEDLLKINLRIYRILNNHSLRVVAQATGIHHQSILHYETTEWGVPQKNIKKLCKFYNIEQSQLSEKVDMDRFTKASLFKALFHSSPWISKFASEEDGS